MKQYSIVIWSWFKWNFLRKEKLDEKKNTFIFKKLNSEKYMCKLRNLDKLYTVLYIFYELHLYAYSFIRLIGCYMYYCLVNIFVSMSKGTDSRYPTVVGHTIVCSYMSWKLILIQALGYKASKVVVLRILALVYAEQSLNFLFWLVLHLGLGTSGWTYND